MRMATRDSLWKILPFVGMVLVECADVGLTTLSKAAMTRGMSHFVFVVYSNALATLIMLPSSFICHRTNRPPLTLSLVCKFFMLSLIGLTLTQNCVFTGVNYSSPTLGSAMGNLIPGFTFIIAVIFRMEKIDLRSSSSQAKIVGTVTSIIGAMIITLYKGPSIGKIPSTPFPSPEHASFNFLKSNNWVLGGLFLTIASLSVSIWNNLQAATVKEFPAEMIIVTFNCFFGTLQSAVVSLIAERNPNSWILRPDLELVSILYSAFFGSVLTPVVVTWCMYSKGPVFVAMFKPLGIVIAMIMGVIFLGDTLHLGSLFGAVIVSAGFYGVIWGQSKEEKIDVEDNAPYDSRSTEHRIPLLQNLIKE